MVTREAIGKEIVQERFRQDTLVGIEVLDQTNSVNDYVAYATAYLGRAADKCARNQREGQNMRASFIKTAALCIAAVESLENGEEVDGETQTN